MGIGKLCFKDKTGENIPFENGFYFKSLDSWESENYVSRAKPPKIFRSKLEKIRCVWESEFYVSRTKPAKIFASKLEKIRWHYRHFLIILGGKNVHFGLYAPSILNTKCETSKIRVVTIMLSKRIFCPKKL